MGIELKVDVVERRLLRAGIGLRKTLHHETILGGHRNAPKDWRAARVAAAEREGGIEGRVANGRSRGNRRLPRPALAGEDGPPVKTTHPPPPRPACPPPPLTAERRG